MKTKSPTPPIRNVTIDKTTIIIKNKNEEKTFCLLFAIFH